MKPLIAISLYPLVLFPLVLDAEDLESANYTMEAIVTDGGGGNAASADIEAFVSIGGVGGYGVAEPMESPIVLHGAAALQAVPLSLTGRILPAPSLDEESSAQLELTAVLDDATLSPLPASLPQWSIASGPATVRSSGRVTTLPVHADTEATASGEWYGLKVPIRFSVLDSSPDNFGIYAGDALPDAWQVLYFGLDNLLAAPEIDPIGKGLTNRFSWLAGLDPLDPNDRFQVRIEPDAAAGKADIVFSPVLPDRTYTVMASPQLQPGPWLPLAAPEVSDEGGERTVTDTEADPQRKFYRIDISAP